MKGLNISWHPVIAEHIIINNGQQETVMFIKDAIKFASDKDNQKQYEGFCQGINEFAKSVGYI